MNTPCAILFSVIALMLSATSYAAPPLPVINAGVEIKQDPYANDGVSFRSLCYHDVRDGLRGTLRDWPEATAIDTQDLIQQFSWLKENGYHVVSLDAIIAAHNGGAKLPPNAVLLTFDDGYASVYTRVFPLLKLFGYPAVIGLVGEWLEENQDGKVFYSTRWLPREQFVTWPQVREMVDSGLVEVASHSHSLHKGLIANVPGSAPPATITRAYDAAGKSYESDAHYSARLREDLAKNSALIERFIGKKPRVMIWPYGAYGMLGVEAAQAEGMPITMTLEPGPHTPDQPLSRIRRTLVYFNHTVGDLKSTLRQPAELDGDDLPLRRVVRVSLDSVYDADPAEQEKKVGLLIERIARLRINTVYLQAYADTNADGAADALYFPNRHLTMRSDLFNRVAWQLRMRAEVVVHACLPVVSFKLPGTGTNVRDAIKDIYEDLAKNAPVFGLLLLDDAARGDIEDLSNFAQDLIARFRVHQPAILTTGTVAVPPMFTASSEQQFAAAIEDSLRHYDFVTLPLTSDRDGIAQSAHGLEMLATRVGRIPGALKRTVFELSTIDARTQKPIPSDQLVAQLATLRRNGARNFGYYPDQFDQNQPAFDIIRRAISLETNPGRRP